ncbi:MAG: hypothetical protein L6R39_002247 [Caloplaca ligustica]|nr:MAG: hypothetical protein L6R39_002247 [Caloplaca ligustica]
MREEVAKKAMAAKISMMITIHIIVEAPERETELAGRTGQDGVDVNGHKEYNDDHGETEDTVQKGGGNQTPRNNNVGAVDLLGHLRESLSSGGSWSWNDPRRYLTWTAQSVPGGTGCISHAVFIAPLNRAYVPYVAKTLPRRPTNTDKVVLGQFPPFSKTVKTSRAEAFCGAIWLHGLVTELKVQVRQPPT